MHSERLVWRKAFSLHVLKGLIPFEPNFKYSSREHNLPLERSLHALVAMCPGKPFPLEYYALKKVVELGIPLSELPTKALRGKATKGFLSTKEEAEEFVNSEGKDYLEINCENIDSDESWTTYIDSDESMSSS